MDLLALVIGEKRAKSVYAGKLTPLFQPEGGEHAVEPELQAAHELVQRWLCEVLRDTSPIESPTAARAFVSTYLRHKQYESFTVLFLDTRHRLIAAEELFRGSVDSAPIFPREVVRRAMQLNASAVLLAHNHPSGISEPSVADRALTKRLVEALALVDVRVLDHLVVGDVTVASMAELGML